MNKPPRTDKSARTGIKVMVDRDVNLLLRRHRAETGETVSDTINRLIRHWGIMPSNGEREPAA